MPATRRVIAGVSGSPGSVHTLRQAAALARHHGALLTVVHTWRPPDSDRRPWPELRQLWHGDAWQRLWDTLDTAFGGLPAGLTTQPAVLRGKPGKVLTALAAQDGGLLVTGAGRRGPLRPAGGRAARYCLATPPARCWPSRPPTWPAMPTPACAAGPAATAPCAWTPPSPPRRPPHPPGPAVAPGHRPGHHRKPPARAGNQTQSETIAAQTQHRYR